MQRLIDTHAHLNFAEYINDNHEIIQDSLKSGIFIINVGTNYFSSERAIQIAQRYPAGVYAAIGLHPSNIQYDLEAPKLKTDKPEDIVELDFNAKKYAKLAESKKVVAVGEIGLDYLNLPNSNEKAHEIKKKQQKIFLKQLNFARSQKLPVIIHCRLAHDEMIEILTKDFSANGKFAGVIHCFTATKDQAQKYYDLGFYFGLNGVLFKMGLDEVVAEIPLNRLLLETDCPFLAPHRQGRASPLQEGAAGKSERNMPQNLPMIAQRVAQIRNDSVDTIIDASTANAKSLFKIV